MAQYDDGVILHWNQRKHTRSVSYLPSTNTSLFHSAPGARSYRTYVAVIEALRACTPHFRQEQVIQHPIQPSVTPEFDEFIADENLLLHTDYYTQASEGVSSDDDTPCEAWQLGFRGVHVSVEQDDDLTASDEQTELMRWHYRLGHLSFVKLKSLATLDPW